ncbi:MAG: N-acetylmuramoyl-L-alanine amidase [Candidatus Poribacteria bacterium]|nr:N-acetylmuramoyl-L-alanine amidase [Candidatus Poribacteria bacterium]
MSVKKQKLLLTIIVMPLLCLFSVGLSADAPELVQEGPEIESPFRLKTIVLDAGHGGRDPGKVSPWRVEEKDINLAIVFKLSALIHEKTEYEVYLTRSTDRWVSLADRARLANRFPADQTLFISIHCNAHTDRSVHGLESYIFNLKATDKLAARLARWENAEEIANPIDFIVNNLYQRGSEKYSWAAARIVQSVLVSDLKIRNRNQNAPDKLVRRAPFRVLVDTKMPALLIELGYLSNRAEHEKLNSAAYQDKVAKALLTSIQQFDQSIREAPKNGNMAGLPSLDR